MCVPRRVKPPKFDPSSTNLPTYHTHPPSFDAQTQKQCGKKLQFIINMLTRFQYNHMHPVPRSVSCAPPAAAASSPPSLETQQTPVVVAPTTTSTDCALSVWAELSHFSKYDYRQCTIIAYYDYVRSLAAVVEGRQDIRMKRTMRVWQKFWSNSSATL